MPSTLSLADLVNEFVAMGVHQTYRNARAFAWQEGYGAFSASKSEERKVINYIRNQESHHRKRTFKEEFVTLLDRHGIEYDERYLWD